jgi:hypothetical protein
MAICVSGHSFQVEVPTRWLLSGLGSVRLALPDFGFCLEAHDRIHPRMRQRQRRISVSPALTEHQPNNLPAPDLALHDMI